MDTSQAAAIGGTVAVIKRHEDGAALNSEKNRSQRFSSVKSLKSEKVGTTDTVYPVERYIVFGHRSFVVKLVLSIQ